MAELLKTEIKTYEDFSNMERMISKECQRISLTELCECWGFYCDAFYDFISLAKTGFEKRILEKTVEESHDN